MNKREHQILNANPKESFCTELDRSRHHLTDRGSSLSREGWEEESPHQAPKGVLTHSRGSVLHNGASPLQLLHRIPSH